LSVFIQQRVVVSTAAIRFTMCLSQAAGIQSVSLSLRVALVTNLDLRAVGRCVRDTDRHTDRRRHTHTHTHTHARTHTHTHTHTQLPCRLLSTSPTLAPLLPFVQPSFDQEMPRRHHSQPWRETATTSSSLPLLHAALLSCGSNFSCPSSSLLHALREMQGVRTFASPVSSGIAE
jgi:hypothetical protein